MVIIESPGGRAVKSSMPTQATPIRASPTHTPVPRSRKSTKRKTPMRAKFSMRDCGAYSLSPVGDRRAAFGKPDEEDPHQVVGEGDGEDRGADRHRHLGDPQRPRVLSLGHVVEFPGPVRRLDGVEGEVGGDCGAHPEAPQLAPTARAPQSREEQIHPDVRPVVERVGEREERGSRHAVACVAGGAGKDLSRPAGRHLRHDDREQQHEEAGGECPAPEVERVEGSAQSAGDHPHVLLPVNPGVTRKPAMVRGPVPSVEEGTSSEYARSRLFPSFPRKRESTQNKEFGDFP